jgi:hypothetical protein
MSVGVMLSMDGARPARSRRRGQHVRSAEDQACVDAFDAFLRDTPAAGRSLNRLGATVLAGRLLPAARALAQAVDSVLAESDQPSPAAGQNVPLNFTVSPSCLLGLCRDGSEDCVSPMCEHDCHSGYGPPSPGRRVTPGTASSPGTV